MESKRATAFVVAGVAVLLVVAVVFQIVQSRPDEGTAGEASQSVVGSFVLDRADFQRRLEAEADRWAAAQAPSAAEQPAVEREGRMRAAESAARMRVRLDLRPDQTFTLSVENEVGASVGSGTWARDKDALALTTGAVEGAVSEGPIPVLYAAVDGDDLLMRASPGIPFAHRLVREPRQAP